MKHVIALSSILLLVGCASTLEEPEWLDGESAEYPATRYLIGLGQADSAGIARDRARADLAKVFQVRVDEQLSDRTTAERTGGKQTSESHIERRLSVHTDQVLSGITVPAVWRDDSGKHHALAVYDRLKAAEKLRAEARSLDGLVEREIVRAREDRDLLARIGAAVRAADAQRTREQVQDVLRVVDVSGIGVPSPYDSARLDSDARALAGRVSFNVTVGLDPTTRLASLIEGSVTQAGFSTASDGQADYRLRGALYVDDVEADGWHWARGTLSLTLLDQSGQVRGSWEWPVKASGRQPELARQRLVQETDRALRKHLQQAILSP